MFMKSNNTFKQDPYYTRKERISFLNKPDTVFARSWLCGLVVLGCVFVDLLCMKVIWNLVQTENPLFVWSIAAACAVALDVPLAIAGTAVKRYHQGLGSRREKNIILILSVAVFTIAFICSFIFRLYTRNLSFDIGTGSTLTNTMEAAVVENNTNNSAVIVAAVFNGILPLLTSATSYIFSYFSSDFLGKKIARLEKERVGIQSNILEAEKALIQAETSEVYCNSLIARENDLYHGFLSRLEADGLELKQLVRILVMEKQNSPEAVTEVAKGGQELLEKYPADQEPERELLEYINHQIDKEKNNVTDFTDHAA